MSSIGMNRNISSTALQRPPSNKSSSTEDSLGKPIGGLARFDSARETPMFDDEGSSRNPFKDERNALDIRELNDEAILWAKHALGELPMRTYATAFDSGYLLQDILKVLRRYKIVYEWWIIQVPRLDVLQGILERHVPMAQRSQAEMASGAMASEVTLKVFRMLLNRKSLLARGVIGMLDLRLFHYDMPQISMKVVLDKLRKESIINDDLEILEIPPREWFESQFGKEGGPKVRMYLWSRRNHVVASVAPTLRKSFLWFGN
jgi:hypothetical protein